MATTTTNFGWDIPQSTDLVKDGATAIAALGQDIDTAFVDFKGGTTGQVLKKTSGTDLDVEWGTASSGLTLINTTSFSAVASQSINDVFSATYKSYLIIATYTCTTASPMNMRLRVSGTDNSASNYGWAYVVARNGYHDSNGANTNTSWEIAQCDSFRQNSFSMSLHNPFATEFTTFQNSSSSFNNVNQIYYGHSGATSVNTSYTGFTLIPPGNITGAVSIYGYSV